MTTGAALAAVVLAAGASMLPAGWVPHPVPPERALHAMEVPAEVAGGPSRLTGTPVGAPPGALVMFPNWPWIVGREVTIVSSEPVTLPAGVEHVGTRLAYRECDGCRIPPGRTALPRWVLYSCTDDVPPSGYGPTYDAHGAVLRPFDPVVFYTYVRAAQPGRYAVDGLRVRYTVRGDRRVYTAEARGLGIDLTVGTREQVAAFDVYSTCSQPAPGFWESVAPPGSMPVR